LGRSPNQQDLGHWIAQATAVNLTRHLVNLPPNLCGPADLARIAKSFGRNRNIICRVFSVGEKNKKQFPGLYAVGRAKGRKPRMIELRYQSKKYTTTLLLIGKGVTFDTGGYNIKNT
jgi:leucyl aminopeptidase